MAEEITLKVGGMSCGHCKMRIEKALKTLDGVEDVQVDLQAESAKVRYDAQRVTEEALKAVIGDAGYEIK